MLSWQIIDWMCVLNPLPFFFLAMSSGCLLVQQWNAISLASVCDRHVACSNERVRGVVRQQWSPAVHCREVGQHVAVTASPYLVIPKCQLLSMRTDAVFLIFGIAYVDFCVINVKGLVFFLVLCKNRLQGRSLLRLLCNGWLSPWNLLIFLMRKTFKQRTIYFM